VERPPIESIRSGDELKRWYWLKSEIVAFARTRKLPYGGAKFDIIERVATMIDQQSTPHATQRSTKQNAKPASQSKAAFVPWHLRELSLDTVIEEHYTNGPSTRAFFVDHCGSSFRFTIPFMAWMRANAGRTLGDAIIEWERQNAERKKPGFKTAIPDSNQYNLYLRELFADNPNATMTQAAAAPIDSGASPLLSRRYAR
jgi:Domain of unknown function (DUF6434)/SAP domain-containing new25